MKAANRRPSVILAIVLLQIVYWCIIGATTAGLLARFVRPGLFWMFQLSAVVLPYLAWSTVLATVLLPVFKRRQVIGVHLLVLVWLAVRFISFPGDESAVDDGSLSIITYNSPYPQHRVSPENEAEFREMIETYQPNVVGFQEAFLGYLERDIHKIVGRGDIADVFESAGYEVARPKPEASIVFYQPLLTNFRVDSTAQIMLEGNPYPVETEITRIHFLWEGRPVVLFNLHLASYGASKPWQEENASFVSANFWLKYLRQYRDAIRARAWEADQIRGLIDREDSPLIIAGDFNATRHNWSYNRIRGQMQDVFHTAGEGPSKTYHARYPFARIDHILVGAEFEALESAAIPTDRSDHRALWGRVGFKEEE